MDFTGIYEKGIERLVLLGTRMAPDSGLYLGEHERKSVYAGKNGSRQRHGEYGII